MLLPVAQSAVINKAPVENEIRTFSRKTRLHPSTVDVSRNALILQGNKAKVIYTGRAQGSSEYVTEFFFNLSNN
jgi:hypothetical protein